MLRVPSGVARGRTRGVPTPVPSWSLTPQNAAAKIAAGLMTFSRGTLATQVNADGSIGWAPHNLFLWSEDISNAAWLKSLGGTVAAGLSDPFGGNTAQRWDAANGAGAGLQQNYTIPAGTVTLSGWFRVPSGTRSFSLNPHLDFNGGQTFTLTTSWQFFSSTTSGLTPGAAGQVRIDRTNPGNAPIEVCRLQLNAGTTVDYYKTTSAAYHGLRVADYSDSPKVPVLGAPFLLNPNFSDPSLLGWTVSPPTSGFVGHASGRGRIYSGDGSFAALTTDGLTYPAIALQVGKTYRAELDLELVSGGVIFGDSLSGVYQTVTTLGIQKVSFTFVASSTLFQAKRSGGVCDIYIDNVNVREITGYIGTTPGIKIEAAATNLLLNSSAPGNGVGATNNGITTSVVGTGVEAGLNYVDVRFVGTPTNTAASADGALCGGRVAGSASAAYALSWYSRIQNLVAGGGSLVPTLYLVAETSAQGYLSLGPLASGSTKNNPSLAGSRTSVTWTTPATTGLLRVALALDGMTVGVPVDVTVRFGGVQLETGSVATSYIPTAGAPVTRNADVLGVTVGSIAGWNAVQGTFNIAYTSSQTSVTTQAVLWATGPYEFATSRDYMNVGVGTWNGIAETNSLGPSTPVGTLRKFANAFTTTSRAVTQNGRAVQSAASGYNLAPLAGTLQIMPSAPGSLYRLDYYPQALPAHTLRRLTA